MNESKQNLILVFFAIVVSIALLVIPNSDVPKVETYYEPHVVKQGETLSGIVQEYGGNLKKSQALIPNPNVIMPGQKIEIVISGGE